MTAATGLEGALARAQADVEAASRSAASLGRELKRARAASATGQVRDLRRALGAAAGLARELADQVRAASEAYDVDEADLLASGAYAKELLAAAAEAGITIFE